MANGTISVAQAVLEFIIPRAVASPVTIVCNSPAAGSVGVPYLHAFLVSGGVLPLTFAIIAGLLPVGLSLNASTGVVSGVPGEPGTFPFTVQVTDSAAAASSVACSITIGGGQLRITLRGVKRYRACPEDVKVSEVPQAPHVDRAV